MRRARFRWAVGALAVAILVLAGSAWAQAQPDHRGYTLTPNGYRLPVYSSFLVQQADGRLVTTCRRLSEGEIEARELAFRTPVTSLSTARRSTVQAADGITFRVVYSDPDGQGFNDATLGATRRTALETSLRAWSSVLEGAVPVVVEAKMESMADDTTLAGAAPTEDYDIDGVLYPASLAAQLRGQSQNGGAPDITVEFNAGVNWDYALDGRAESGKTSFVYTAIHETGHGLGFFDTVDPDTGEFLNARPTAFDRFLNRGTAAPALLAGRSSDQVKADVVSDGLFFNGPNANAASLVSIRPLPMIKLYAPTTYEQGSSVSHVDQDTYSDVLVGLMTPNDFGPGFDPVDILAAAIMRDLGYQGVVTARSGLVTR
jgi:hypothetical protein